MGLTRVKLDHFTAFTELDLEFSPGVNVLVGANGTGKTHLMKVCYAACQASREGGPPFPEKLVRDFLPSRNAIGRLVQRQGKSSRASLTIHSDSGALSASFTNHTKNAASVKVRGLREWDRSPVDGVFIPVKEMLANAPGFLSLYAEREIHFEGVYNDLLVRAYAPPLRGRVDQPRRRLLSKLQKSLQGMVTTTDQEFFLRNRQGNLEFTLLAEGMRKLGLLWLLIQNGTFRGRSVLFWDKPETNLNPALLGVVVEVLLELQRLGIQVFLATHSYVLLKEIDLSMKDTDKVLFHVFHKPDDESGVVCNTTPAYLGIDPNRVADAFDSLYDRQIQRAVRSLAK